MELITRASIVEDRGEPGLRLQGDTKGKRTVPDGIVDALPEFAMIPKGAIKIDHIYQRGISLKHIKEMAQRWSWAACGAIKVALRPDGEWYAFDGQRRLTAAKMRPDISEMPCLVYEMRTIKEEAKGFLDQTAMRPMTVIDRFKAMVIAGDKSAIFVKNLAEANNLTIRSGVKPGDRALGCASEMLKWAQQDPDTLVKIFPLLVGIIERGGMLRDTILRGLMFIEQHLKEDSITERRWRARMANLTYSNIVDTMKYVAANEGGQHPRACAMGILMAINRGLKRRLMVPGINV